MWTVYIDLYWCFHYSFSFSFIFSCSSWSSCRSCVYSHRTASGCVYAKFV